MGVSLGYATVQPVTDDVRKLVTQAADELSRGRDWWTEPIHFFDDSERPGCLVGNSKLFRAGFDCDDDTFLAWRDIQFIIANLAKWASSFELTWCLSHDVHGIGTVDAKGADERVNEFFSKLADLGRHPTSDPRTIETIAEALLEKYSERDG